MFGFLSKELQVKFDDIFDYFLKYILTSKKLLKLGCVKVKIEFLL